MEEVKGYRLIKQEYTLLVPNLTIQWLALLVFETRVSRLFLDTQSQDLFLFIPSNAAITTETSFLLHEVKNPCVKVNSK